MNQIENKPTAEVPAVKIFEKTVSTLSQSLGLSYNGGANLLSQAIRSSIVVTNNTPTPDWEFISDMIASFDPKNIQEAMLAVQMVGVHYQTVSLLSKATKSDLLSEHYLKLALKMSKLFTSQLETLKKIRSKGEQRMIVEHVHVHNGGQAIVGHVASDKV